MAQPTEDKPIDKAVELPQTNGFNGLADAVTLRITGRAFPEPFLPTFCSRWVRHPASQRVKA